MQRWPLLGFFNEQAKCPKISRKKGLQVCRIVKIKAVLQDIIQSINWSYRRSTQILDIEVENRWRNLWGCSLRLGLISELPGRSTAQRIIEGKIVMGVAQERFTLPAPVFCSHNDKFLLFILEPSKTRFFWTREQAFRRDYRAVLEKDGVYKLARLF